ncbi:zinc finger protein 106-like [Centruroides sculpturatus]|uniref:zinc finger protein 106-like n=1 Tax=Centruroides sculpturatus TaxID=218467 RepID=UPI000C6DE10C|nr:zinc finger protein 106-like [Centruroides sculpturatus]
MDGCLRCFNDLNGQCLQVVEVNSPILCVAKGWDRLYLGLHSGKVSVFSLTTKRIIDVIHCAECAISCIATAAEGAQKILCIASYDTALTVRDAQSGLLLRCLEGQIKPPCSIRISANIVYTSTTERTLLIHNLSSGKLQKVLNWPSSATGLHIMPKFILSCSFDGLVRCYTKEVVNFALS